MSSRNPLAGLNILCRPRFVPPGVELLLTIEA